VLSRVERLQAKSRDDEVGALGGKLAGQNVVLDEVDLVSAVLMEPVQRPAMHSR